MKEVYTQSQSHFNVWKVRDRKLGKVERNGLDKTLAPV